MFLSLLQFFATKFLFLALHLESGCFPRPLTAREEAAAFSALHAVDARDAEKLLAELLQCENVPGAAIIGCVEQYQDCSIYVK